MEYLKNYFEDFKKAFEQSSTENIYLFNNILKILKEMNKENKIVFFGNGASNTIANHALIDFINLTGLKCVSLNDIGLITGWSNDYGYENIVEKYVTEQMNKDDILFLISSSGESDNVIKGCEKAKEKGIKTVTLTGFKEDNNLRNVGYINLWVNSTDYNIVESIHNFWIVSIAEYFKNSIK